MTPSRRPPGVSGLVPQLEIRLARDGDGVTRIRRRRSRYPYVVLHPFWFEDQPEGIASLILQSGSGGLYGGEHLGQRFVLDANAAAHITTQAASVVHASQDLGATVQHLEMRVGPAAHLEYIADPLILFPGANLRQDLEAWLMPGAVLIFADGIVRHDPGPEDRSFAQYASRVTIRGSDSELLVRDSAAVDGSGFDGVLMRDRAGWSATGLVLAAAPGQSTHHSAWCSLVNDHLDTLAPVTKGEAYASCGLLPNDAGVACRIVARDGQALRDTLEVTWRALHQAIAGAPAPRSRK